ncbi:MAG: class I tRNA ligase family protein, partial [Clostridia bacterium]|nr:class I tRNA ligase family protein [Clostridia bacterium]
TVLKTLTGLCAPYIPFMTETMYQNLVVNNIEGAPESVHLCDYPVADMSLVDKELENGMDEVMTVVTLGRACRNVSSLKVRQPLSRCLVKGEKLSGEIEELIKSELNVKKVEFVDDAREFTTYQLKPQMKTLGKKYGKLLGKIGQTLAGMDGNEVVDAFEKGETVKFELDGTMIELEKDDVLTSLMQKPGYVAESDGAYTVVLDTNLTDELINEGFVREVISKVQTMRKEAGFEVTDRIRLTWQTTEKLEKILENGKADLMRAVLAVEAECACADEGAFVREMKINGENAVLAVSVKN